MKASELTPDDVVRFARMEDAGTDIDPAALLAAARSFVRGYTGLTDAEIDQYEDITLAVLVLCADLYENRLMSVDKANVNSTADAILSMYRVNLL